MQDWTTKYFKDLFLFVPFLMAGGAAAYFTMPIAPNATYVFITVAMCAILTVICRKNIFMRAVMLGIIGFTWAAIFTAIVNTPAPTRTMRDVQISGHVENIDYTDKGARLYMRINAADINSNANGDAIVRVSLMDEDAPQIGDTISGTGALFRPSGAYANGAFDYARWAYFNNLSATGYISDVTIIRPGDMGGINVLRNTLHNRANSFLADSLVLGYKNAVPESDGDIWRATGIGHVWSISGFHMTLVSGWLFVIFFAIFRLIAPITRRVPARIPATICAWFGLIFYLVLSGVDVATVRAFLMTTLIFMAVIFGRAAFSMRNICIAFIIIFMINPHYVMQAGFQLSFAAILGLVWLWNDVRPKMPGNKILRVIYAAALTSVTASVFTAPFVIAHFGAMPIYSLVGNLILLPIFSVAIMPLVIIGTITAAFGWTGPLGLATTVYDATFVLAKYIADFPGANMVMPHMPNVAMVFMIMGLVSLVVMRKINYALCGAFITIGVVIMLIYPRPVFYSTYDTELVAFVEDGKMTFNKSRASNHYFAFDTWRAINGDAPSDKNVRRKHNRGVYEFKTENFNLVYIQKYTSLAANIRQLCDDDAIDYIVSYFDVKSATCGNKILRGGFVIYPSGHVERVPNSRRWHHNRRP